MKYLDKSYIEKRKELRRFHSEQPMVYELVSYVVDNVDFIGYPHLNDMLNLKGIIMTLLIDGYISFERVVTPESFSLVQIDPIYICQIHPSAWEIRTPNGTIKKIKQSDLIYLSYSDISYTTHTSLVEQMMITGLSLDVHKKYIDILIKNIPSIFEKFDINYYRIKKLEKILR